MVAWSELLVIMALAHGEQYGPEIIERLAALLGRQPRLAVGGLYTTLRRMETKGLIVGRWGDDRKEREGARRRYYTLTVTGREVLEDIGKLLDSARRASKARRRS